MQRLPLRRSSPEAKAARVATVLDGPDAREAFEAVRNNIIRDIEAATLDGSRASEEKVLELVRQLQCFVRFKLELIRPLINAKLKNREVDLSSNGE